MTRQQLSQQTLTSRSKVQEAETLRKQAKEAVLRDIGTREGELQEYEGEFEEWLQTPSGVVAYSQEFGIAPKVENVSVGWKEGGVINRDSAPVYTYETPYGTYRDESKLQQLKRQIGFKTDIEQAGQQFAEKRRVDITPLLAKYGLTSQQIGGVGEYEKSILEISQSGYTPVDQFNKPMSVENLNRIKGFQTPEGRVVKLKDWNKYVEEIRTPTETIKTYDLPPSTTTPITQQNLSLATGIGMVGASGLSSVSGRVTSHDISPSGLQLSRDTDRGWFRRTIDVFKTKIKEGKTEYYDPKLKMFAKAEEFPQTKTIETRIPTLPEVANIQLAEAKKKEIQSKVVNILQSPIRFIQGEYEWQKKLTPPPTIPQPSPFELVRGQTYGEIIKSDAPTRIVYKVPQDIGTLYFKTTEKLRTWGLKGTKFGEPLTEQQVQRGGDIFAPLILGGFFSPAFTTGASAKQISKQLQKNKYDELGEELGKLGDDFKTSLEVEVANKATTKEQLEYLRKIKEFYKLSDENVKDIIQSLKDKNIIKEAEIVIKSEGKGMIFETKGISSTSPKVEVFGNIPKMKQAGKISGASSSQPNIQQSAVRESVWFSEKTPQAQKQPILQTNIFESSFLQRNIQPQKQQKKQAQGFSQVLGFGQPQSTIQKQQAKQTQTQRQIQRQSLFQPQAYKQQQLTKQVQRQVTKQATKTRTTQKQPPKFPFKFKLPAIQKEKKDSFFGVGFDEFEIYGRRKGKDMLISREKSLFKAKKGLSGFLTGTLGASGFIVSKRTGKKVKINLGMDFTPSKVDPFRVVQKRSKRLGTGAEIFEIKQARKGKKKNKGVNWLK